MSVLSANPVSMSEELFKPMYASKESGTAPVGDSLKYFLEVAMQVAKIDEAIMSARASCPPEEDSEALKWHKVSIKALMWTRSSLVDQQASALGQLKTFATSQRSVALPTSPLASIETRASSTSADTVPFAPTARNLSTHVRAKPSTKPTPSQVGAKVAAGEMAVGSLREDLERLKDYDSKQCLIVRRIKRLGLESPEILRQHFSSFGGVKEMLISHSLEKKSVKCRADRVRPAALGFIVMDSVCGAEAALRAGPTIMIGQVDVEVKIFEPVEALQQRESAETQPTGLKSFQ